jgi:hypothetical protein
MRGPPRTETPLAKLVRVVGGVLLSQGRLAHQVLGQMLILDLNQTELAGAALVVTAGTQRAGLFARTAISTVAPAVALQIMVDKAQRRLDRREKDVERREKALAALLSAAPRGAPPRGGPAHPAPAPLVPVPPAPVPVAPALRVTPTPAEIEALHTQIATLTQANRALEAWIAAFDAERAATGGGPVPPTREPKGPPKLVGRRRRRR